MCRALAVMVEVGSGRGGCGGDREFQDAVQQAAAGSALRSVE